MIDNAERPTAGDRLMQWAWFFVTVAAAIGGFGGGLFLGSTEPIASLRMGRLDADLLVRCATLLAVWVVSAGIGYAWGRGSRERELRSMQQIALGISRKNTELMADRAKLLLIQASRGQGEPPRRTPATRSGVASPALVVDPQRFRRQDF